MGLTIAMRFSDSEVVLLPYFLADWSACVSPSVVYRSTREATGEKKWAALSTGAICVDFTSCAGEEPWRKAM